MERLGRELSASQLDFMKIQHRKNELAAVGKKRKRSTEEDAEFKKLQRKLDNSRRDMVDFDVRLLFKPPPQSKAQMEAIRKAKRTQEMVEKERTNQRVCMAGGDAASHWSPGGVRPQPYGAPSPLHPCPPIWNCWVASRPSNRSVL